MLMDEAFVRRRALSICDEGQTAHFRHDFDRAIALYARSLAVYPTAEAYTYRGWAHGTVGRLDEAIADCHRAIATDPGFGNPYNDIGAYLIQQRRFDEAIPWLEQAQRAERYEPRHFPHMNLGRVFTAKGDLHRAIREYETALVLAPDDAVCRAALVELRGRFQ